MSVVNLPAAPKSSGRGCLFYGAIIAAILLIFLLIAGYAGFHYVRHLVDDYTDTKPIEMPAVRLSATEITNLQERVENFDKALKAGKPVSPLVLTAEEMNALIMEAQKTNAVSPARLYFSFNENRVQAQLSFPTDGLGLQLLRGRYFNGSGDFVVAVHDGKLMLNVKSLLVKGKPLPEQFMKPIRGQNFADAWTNDVEFNQALAKLEEVKIEDGKLFVIPRTNEVDAMPKLESGK